MSRLINILLDSLNANSEKVAIVDQNGSRSTLYKELHEDSLRVAAYLQSQNLPAKSCIGIALPKSAEYFAVEIGCWMCGYTIVPMGDHFPEQRIDYIMGHCDAPLMITSQTMDQIHQTAPVADVIESDEEDMVALFYTSGSTGNPKGVVHTYSSFADAFIRNKALCGMTEKDAFGTGAPMYFMASIFDFTALSAGATIHLYAEELKTNIQLMENYILQHKITCCFMSPTVVSQYDNPSPHLRMVLSASERLSGVDPKGYTLVNGYGQTETAGLVTTFLVDKKYDNTPIGKIASDITYCVMNEDGETVAAGEEGELCLKGNLAKGYFKDEERTAHLWQDGWMHTGDLVKELPDGNILYVNRKDWMVKISGQRVEPGEVEQVLKHCEGVKDAVVKGFENKKGNTYLCAFYISEKEMTDHELSLYLRSFLPEYMVPSLFVKMDKFPLNQNGKVDRKSMESPLENSEANTEKQTLSPLEEELKGMLANLLGNDDFSISDNLGFLGLSSISGIKFASQIYKKYGVQLNTKNLTKTGTLQTIENEILKKWMTSGSAVSEKGHAEHAVPLTFAQTGVYYDIARSPESTAYNMAFMYSFPRGITADMLHQAMIEVLSAHRILGTHFEVQGSDVVQVFPTDYKPEVERVSVASEKELQRLKEEFRIPFNPSRGPLYRAKIVSVGKQTYLLFDTLHMVMDGASVSLFMKQLAEALEGKAPEAEEYTYFDYAEDEIKLVESQEFADSENFFTEQLKTVDGVSNITEDLKPVENAEAHLKFANCLINQREVTSVAKTLGVTPAQLFLAAAYYTVSRYTNTPDVCLCTISNGRSNLQISDTFGMFVNTIAMVSHITDCTVKDFILQTAENFVQSLEHEHYPFAKIAEKFDISPTLFYQYQVGVLDTFKVTVPGKKTSGDIVMTPCSEESPKFKFIISIEPADEENVSIQIQYNDTLYSPEMAQGFADAMGAVMKNFMADVTVQLKSVSMLTEEQAELIASFHETKQAEVPITLYHKLFEHSVEEHADDTALVALNPYTNIYESFTFAKLNSHMNCMAHALMKRGVKPGDRVALLLPRTSRLIMSQYAVLKTGAAYIPCDPKYPTERINLILEDSESRFIITTQDRLAEFPEKAIDVEELVMSGEDKNNPDVQVSPDDLAYLIYTSGSTGRPKGVQLMHKGVCNYHHPENIIQSCLKNECHTALGLTTISFDMSVWETGSPLMLGKTLVFVGDEDCNDPNRLAMLVNEYGVDCMTATTSRFMQLLESPAFEEAFSTHMHMAYQGGEGLSMALLLKLQSYPNVRIFNGYGPTETIANSHASELTHDNIPHIGKPCVNYTNFIIDNDGNELPVGVVGELVIGGNSVARGYNNLPEQTASRFVEYQGKRVYKSGDFARWLPDGNVMVLGRKDNQVKLRGLRIELGEVENAITKVEGVKNVAVMIKKLSGKDHLCAYFTADREIAIDDMKAEISKTLTHYMVPSAYLQMDEFPLTPNGKTDVKHLPEPVLAKVGGEYVAPKNKTEMDFCGVFGQILDLEQVSTTDSFFDLGGSSLTATRVVIEATNLGYTISYSDVFDHPTVKQLAQLINNGVEQGVDHEVVDYDYTKIDELLSKNTLDAFRQGEALELGNVVLTGANGYLGIHILHELLENYLPSNPDCKVYCLVRHGRNGVTSESRLCNLLYYYFEKNYKYALGNQLVVVDGDVTNASAFDSIPATKDSTWTVINCAAIVKHFSEGTEIEDINIGGLQKCVDWCLKTGAQLIQTSTNSTAGQLPQDEVTAETVLDEQHSYIGQILNSKYTHSKFIAERILFEAIVEKGLVGKVMRLGNLSPRTADGEFQINFRSNSSMGRLHIFQMLGAYSYGFAEMDMEFSPIDEVAKAIVILSQTPKECVVFHPVNYHQILMGDVVREMSNALGINIEEVEDDVFKEKVQEAGRDPEKANILQSMLAYFSGNDNLVYLKPSIVYTNRVLARKGFHWNVTSWDYVQRFIQAIAAMDFFEDRR